MKRFLTSQMTIQLLSTLAFAASEMPSVASDFAVMNLNPGNGTGGIG